jgi:hypothetical protein
VPEPIQNEPHPIFKAIESGNLKEVNDIINKDPSVLYLKDSKRINPIVYAISLNKSNIVEKIIEKEPLVLEQRDLSGKTPVFYAIALENLMVVDEILFQKPLVIEQKDLAGNTPVDLATVLSIISLGNNKNDRASRVLKKVLEYKFPGNINEYKFLGNINNDSRENFKELFLKEMLLKGIYSAQTVSFSFKVLEKAFDKVTPENTFKKIYQDLFENVDKNQPITSKNNEKMFIFQSKLKGHESFFIFHVNEDNKYKYKIGLLDFGIVYELNKKFKETWINLCLNYITLPSSEIAKLILSYTIEPYHVFNSIPKEHSNKLISMASNLIEDIKQKSKKANQIQLYKFLYDFNNYLSNNYLLSLGLRLSEEFVRMQMSIAMSHGITITLCKDNYVAVTDRILNELFHTELLDADTDVEEDT